MTYTHKIGGVLIGGALALACLACGEFRATGALLLATLWYWTD